VLLKPGAEKLCALFRLAPTFDVRTKDLPGGHREERVTCTLTHIGSGTVVATGVGSCSTMEAKYRYRNGKPKCPTCGRDAIGKSTKEFYCWAKRGGCGATFPLQDQRITSQPIGLVENRDLADTFNTVLKMAMKRAHIGATLLATAASDAFVVDDEHEQGPEDDQPEPDAPEPRRGAAPKQRRADATEPKLTPKQELARDCAKMASDLGMPGDDLKKWLADNGVPPFAKWSDLDEPSLQRARATLQAHLQKGSEVRS
jgi:hypothetical protein